MLALKELENVGRLSGGQVCIIDKTGKIQVDVVGGSLGGLRSHIPMRRDALILGYSTTKAITATLAHVMVQEGYLTYDEPICERVWKQFCPYPDPPIHLDRSLKLSNEEVERRWKWKQEITLPAGSVIASRKRGVSPSSWKFSTCYTVLQRQPNPW